MKNCRNIPEEALPVVFRRVPGQPMNTGGEWLAALLCH
jgi:hypothetical protein